MNEKSFSLPRDAWILGGLFFLGGLVSFLPLWDIDWPLHVVLGRAVLDQGALPWKDTLSWTAAGRPQVLHEWLFQVLWALLAGLGGPALLKAAVSLFTGTGLALWFRAARKAGRERTPSLFFALAALLLFYPRLRARPDLVTWMALPVALPFLLPSPAPLLRRSAALLALVALWANFHGAALLAPLWFWAGWAGETWGAGKGRPTFPALPIAATLGVFLTPSGTSLVGYAWRTKGFAGIVPEWSSLAHLPPTQVFLALQFFLGGLGLLLLLSLAWNLGKRGCLPKEGSLWGAGAAGTAAGIFAYRFTSASLPGLLFLLPQRPGRKARAALNGASLALVLLLLSFWAGRFSPRLFQEGRYPVAAADYLAGRNLPAGTRLFHEPGWGGYLAYRLHPRALVAVDGRVTTYGPRLCSEILRICKGEIPPPGVEAWLEKGKVDLVVMPGEWGETFLSPSRWKRLFQGPLASVWAKRGKK